jgi:LuxR family transcriptional regulator, maltose regulon positive regulatory protein
MYVPILATKLYIPPARPNVVLRPRLIERLNGDLPAGHTPGVTLISAPAGYGKTTLVSKWIAGRGQVCERPVAWLSLDEGDNDPVRFLAYLVAALQTIAPNFGAGVLGMLHAGQPQPPSESLLTALLNEIASIPDNFVLVLDDYHVIEAQAVDHILTFLLGHLPPQMHLVITTREDPNLPLARLRARGQLTELRAADLRFTPAEAAEFINQGMGLNLAAEDITALETHTEGWIAGLQLAALAMLAMQGQKDTASFVKSFTGSHHFVMDYLVEEVLQQQPASVQTFLLRTSILERMCGPLCDVVLLDPSGSGQETLEYLERANLFIIPLDNERRWYRYHHLFADLLRQRLQLSSASQTEDTERRMNELHMRASQWYADNGFELEAFQHAAAAKDVERAERLIEGEGIPLQFRGASAPVRNWLEALPRTALDARPSLWVTYASTLLFGGQHTAVEQKLQAAEAAFAADLQGSQPDARTKDLLGRIASMRATLAVIQHDVESIITQSRRALEYLHPDNLSVRTATTWTLGYAYQVQGKRAAASQAYTEIIAAAKSIGDSIYTTAATINLGQIQEADNQLALAAKTYRRVLQLTGDPPDPIACEAFLGLARITYQWNDLDAAQQHGQECLQLTRQMESVDTFAAGEVFLARLKLAQRDAAGAAAILAEAEAFVRQHNFVHQMPAVAAAQVLTLLQQGNLTAAAALAETHELPISQARVYLAQGDPSSALALLEPWRQEAEVKGWQDERLKVIMLEAIAYHALGEKDKAAQGLGEALALAEPGGFIRIFVDEGQPMADLLNETLNRGIAPDYVRRLLAAFPIDATQQAVSTQVQALKSELVEPLSQRELEVLRLMAQGLSNGEISEQLFLALSTVKGHNQIIFGKLQVQRRTEAVARARELGLL